MSRAYEEILAYVRSLQIYDTHEHLPHREEAHIISPPASIDALAEWIESAPLTKVSAFGVDAAQAIAERVFVENPRRLFALPA